MLNVVLFDFRLNLVLNRLGVRFRNCNAIASPKMNSLYSIILLAISLAVWSNPNMKMNEIDWEAEIFGLNNRWQLEYGAQELEHVTRDIWMDDFVYISPKSIILGDFDDLIKTFEGRRKIGHWEIGPSHIVSTCHNDAMTWAKIYFVDDKNHTQEGTHAILFEYLSEIGKVKEKITQFTE